MRAINVGIALVVLGVAAMGGAAQTAEVQFPTTNPTSDACASMNVAHASQPPRCARVLANGDVYYVYALSSDNCRLGGPDSAAPPGSNPTMGIYEEWNNQPGLQTEALSSTPDKRILANCWPWDGP